MILMRICFNFRLVRDAFRNHAHQVDLNNKSNVLAGIVQTDLTDISTAKVVVLSTGTKNIDADALYEQDANLPDTHAEVVARRALLVYLYQQLELFFAPGPLNYVNLFLIFFL